MKMCHNAFPSDFDVALGFPLHADDLHTHSPLLDTNIEAVNPSWKFYRHNVSAREPL